MGWSPVMKIYAILLKHSYFEGDLFIFLCAKQIFFFRFCTLGAILILRKDIGVGGWSRKWQFVLTLCSENVLT